MVFLKCAQELYEAIAYETKYVDKDTGRSVHANLGMFALVLMGHGGYGCMKTKTKDMYLEDIYRLLAPDEFPAMRGKPKMIILQACSGGEVC
jgi:hypothetical protein